MGLSQAQHHVHPYPLHCWTQMPVDQELWYSLRYLENPGIKFSRHFHVASVQHLWAIDFSEISAREDNPQSHRCFQQALPGDQDVWPLQGTSWCDIGLLFSTVSTVRIHHICEVLPSLTTKNSQPPSWLMFTDTSRANSTTVTCPKLRNPPLQYPHRRTLGLIILPKRNLRSKITTTKARVPPLC